MFYFWSLSIRAFNSAWSTFFNWSSSCRRVSIYSRALTYFFLLSPSENPLYFWSVLSSSLLYSFSLSISSLSKLRSASFSFLDLSACSLRSAIYLSLAFIRWWSFLFSSSWNAWPLCFKSASLSSVWEVSSILDVILVNCSFISTERAANLTFKSAFFAFYFDN